MKYTLVSLILTLTALNSRSQTKFIIDTFDLKNKFSMPDSYLNFRFDYDSLRIDTVQYRSGEDKYIIKYTGYKYELDSIKDGDGWFNVTRLKDRFYVEVSDGVLTFIQEMYEDINGEGVTGYEFNPLYKPNVKMYRSFKLDEGPAFMVLSDSLDRRVSIDNANIYLDSARNVTKFYHLNDLFEKTEVLDGHNVNSFTYHDNGALKENFTVNKYDQKEGRYTKYYKDGFLETTGFHAVIDDIVVKDGLWIYYDSVGVPIRYELYVNGTIVDKKKMRGLKKLRRRIK